MMTVEDDSEKEGEVKRHKHRLRRETEIMEASVTFCFFPRVLSVYPSVPVSSSLTHSLSLPLLYLPSLLPSQVTPGIFSFSQNR